MTDATIEAVAAGLGRDHSARFERRMPNRATKAAGASGEPVISNGLVRLIVLISGFALAAAAFILLAAHYLGNEIAKGGYSDSRQDYEIVIGNDALAIPSNMIRFSSQRKSGSQNKVDIFMHWPTMQGYSEKLKQSFATPDGQDDIVFVTLEPRAMPIDMSGRIEPIYKRFFDGPPIKAGHGLIRQPLNSESGYIDEDLYIEKDSPYPFVARCLRERLVGGKPYCIRDIHIGRDMMATYRFHNSILPKWINLDQMVRNRLNLMLME